MVWGDGLTEAIVIIHTEDTAVMPVTGVTGDTGIAGILPLYSGWYGSAWDWDFGWGGYGWDYPYYGGYYSWGGYPYSYGYNGWYGGGWYGGGYGRSIPYNYTSDSRRQAATGTTRSSMTGSRFNIIYHRI